MGLRLLLASIGLNDEQRSALRGLANTGINIGSIAELHLASPGLGSDPFIGRTVITSVQQRHSRRQTARQRCIDARVSGIRISFVTPWL